MSDYANLKKTVSKGDIKGAVAETEQLLSEGTAAQSILDDGLIAAMDEVGERFSKGQLFVPHMLRSAKTMQECMGLLQPHFKEGDVQSKGKVVIGTVKGDLHDIGKNLVSMMMEGAGFALFDLGVDVKPDAFVQKAQEVDADIVALSALLSTTMPSMRDTIEALREAGLKDRVKVMIGGAPVTESYAKKIEADAYAPDAGAAVAVAKELIGIS